MPIEKGRLKSWNDDKGFGFIKRENGENDIFIHISALKSMSRKPVRGDIIFFDVSFDDSGKNRAINAKIEGVSQLVTLVPKNSLVKSVVSSNPKARTHRKSLRRNKPGININFVSIVIVIVMGFFIYSNVVKRRSFTDFKETQPAKIKEHFQCQGKVWCTEMRSYEEAVFYLQNCPGTKMDGDGDGEPCEQQF